MSNVIAKPVWPVLQRGHPLAQGLVGAWPFYEGVGNTAHDLSGKNNAGTLQGSPPWVGGAFGSALSFNGTSQYVSIGALAVVPYPFTFICWFKTNDVTNVTTLMSFGAGATNFDRLFVYGPHSAHVSLQSQVAGGTPSTIAETSVSVQTGVWYFATAVFASSTSRTVYVNAGSVGSSATSVSPGSLSTMRIGRNDNGVADEYFNGVIDDPRVYNRALSAAEVAQLYFDSFAIYRPVSRWWEVPVGGAAPTHPSTLPMMGAGLLYDALRRNPTIKRRELLRWWE